MAVQPTTPITKAITIKPPILFFTYTSTFYNHDHDNVSKAHTS